MMVCGLGGLEAQKAVYALISAGTHRATLIEITRITCAPKLV